MKLEEVLKPGGRGIIATASKDGEVNTAVYAVPHVVDAETVRRPASWDEDERGSVERRVGERNVGARGEAVKFASGQKEIMVMRELPEPKKAYILFRGEYNQRRDEVVVVPGVRPVLVKILGASHAPRGEHEV